MGTRSNCCSSPGRVAHRLDPFGKAAPSLRYRTPEFLVRFEKVTSFNQDLKLFKVASLPYRFKAGGGMAPMVEGHHHRSTNKAPNKPFKSKHATKSLLKDLSKGKVEGGSKRSQKPLHQQVMSKIQRRHQARQKQQNKHQEHTKSASVFSGQNGAPRNVVVVPLTSDGNPQKAVQKLNRGVDVEVQIPSVGLITVRIDRFKQNLEYILVDFDLLSVLDACKMADFVIFILSPSEEVDAKGELLLRAIESQGVSNVLTVVQELNDVEPAKRRPQVTTSLKSYISRFFPGQEKVHSLDSVQDCANVLRSICTATPRGIRWREDRSWMLVDDVQWLNQDTSPLPAHCEVVVTGVVRGKGLQADRLVQVGDWGTYQIDRIVASTPGLKKRKADEMAVVEIMPSTVIGEPSADQDDLTELAPDDVAMGDVDDKPISEAPTERRGVLLDDHHYFSDDETHLPEQPKRLPKGTSSYQAAWFLGDMSESGSDIELNEDDDGDIGMDAPALPQDGYEGLDHNFNRDATEAGPSEYPQSEMFLDPSPNDEVEELEAYRSSRKTKARDDLEFPDEIELHPNVLARERLARYRGLKSLRTSAWETSEDRAHEPDDWNRLLRIVDYNKSKSQAVREALAGGVVPGTHVQVHIRNVPLSYRGNASSKRPLALYSLLRHEQKLAVVNFSLTLNSDHPDPIKSKEELIMQCGPRRFIISPLFSQTGHTPNNVHKFDRYVHPGRTAMATFIAPLTWGSVPALFFQRKTLSDPLDITDEESFELIGTGTSQAPDYSRVIAKRIILTGHPYKIHKKVVTVRYMFFNTEDVNWFKALQLWTKRGRSGYIKEGLGTHGYFKATFDARINPQDSIGVSLYKRMFPRKAIPWKGASVEAQGDTSAIEVMPLV